MRAWFFPSLVALVAVVGSQASLSTLAWLPAPLLLATLLAHTATKPARWLSALALISELFSVQPLGVMTAAIFLPWMTSRITPRLEVSFSIWFFAYLLLVSALQVFCLFAATLWQGWQFLPWPAALVSTLAAAVAAFLLLTIRIFILPPAWAK